MSEPRVFTAEELEAKAAPCIKKLRTGACDRHDESDAMFLQAARQARVLSALRESLYGSVWRRVMEQPVNAEVARMIFEHVIAELDRLESLHGLKEQS